MDSVIHLSFEQLGPGLVSVGFSTRGVLVIRICPLSLLSNSNLKLVLYFTLSQVLGIDKSIDQNQFTKHSPVSGAQLLIWRDRTVPEAQTQLQKLSLK